jgi:hypothetical protein
MITLFLKVLRHGDVKHLKEVNHHPSCESHKLCMKCKKI